MDLFHIDGQKVIPRAKAKNQCAEDYFYGADKYLEKALQGPEGHYASIVRSLERGGHARPDDLKFLIQYFVLQTLRTFGIIERMLAANAQLHSVLDTAHAPEGLGYKQSWQEAVDLAILAAMDVISGGQVSDLRVCMATNLTDRPFITSDDPAIHLNRYYRQKLRHDGFGYLNTGSMFFLPLTPSHMLIAFDSDCYSCSGRKGDIIEISRRDEVDCLNQIQMLNARRALYLPPNSDHELITKQFETWANRRPKSWLRLTYFVEEQGRSGVFKSVPEMPDELGFIQHAEQIRPAPEVWPGFLPFKNRIRSQLTGTGAGDLRPGVSLGNLDWQRFAKSASL